MYNLPGTRMPCLHILGCSTSIPSPAPAKSSFASNFVHEYLTNQSQQGMWKVILLILILPNILQPGGEGCWSYISTYLQHKRTPAFSSCWATMREVDSGVTSPFTQWECCCEGYLASEGGAGAAGAEWWVVSHRETQWGHTSGHLLLVTLSSSLSPLLDIQPCLPEIILSLH